MNEEWKDGNYKLLEWPMACLGSSCSPVSSRAILMTALMKKDKGEREKNVARDSGPEALVLC